MSRDDCHEMTISCLNSLICENIVYTYCYATYTSIIYQMNHQKWRLDLNN